MFTAVTHKMTDSKEYRQETTLSIIVPAYNVEEYIEECLESIVQQTASPDEVILVNDGSTDSTFSILKYYADSAKFRLITTSNHGLGSARNLGLALATSEFIHFLDSDDILHKTFVETFKDSVYEQPDVDLFLFNSSVINYHEDSIIRRTDITRKLTGVFSREDRLITKLSDLDGGSTSACMYVSRASLWSRHRLRFLPIVHEDEPIFYPLLAYSRKVICFDGFIYYYRMRPESLTNSAYSLDKLLGLRRAIDELISFMQRERELVAPEITAWNSKIANLLYIHTSVAEVLNQPYYWSVILRMYALYPCTFLTSKLSYMLLPREVRKLIQKLPHNWKSKCSFLANCWHTQRS